MLKCLISEDLSENELSDDQSPLADKQSQKLTLPPNKKTTILGDHRPHELSTIQVC